MLTYPEYLAHLDADSHLLAAAAARGLDADVPGCPGWAVADLVTHVGSVHARSVDIVEQSYIDTWPARRGFPEGEDLLDWFRRNSAQLVEVLAAADPAAPAITFSIEQTVGFWIRRMTHETLVHRIDAEQAHDYESLVDPGLAVDGIAEMFEVFAGRFPDWGEFAPENEVVRVVAGEGDWVVRLGRFVGTRKKRKYDIPKLVDAQGTKPAATISGDPDRVMLWLWGRASLDQVTVSGDSVMADRLREVCSI
jgi:uncharacterized protein (TIGR03083 family)